MLSPDASAKLVAQAVSQGAKPEVAPKRAQFIQIAVADTGVVTAVWALDAAGGVWALARDRNNDPEGWMRVTTKRLPITNR